jgi:hypothetical protein
VLWPVLERPLQPPRSDSLQCVWKRPLPASGSTRKVNCDQRCVAVFGVSVYISLCYVLRVFFCILIVLVLSLSCIACPSGQFKAKKGIDACLACPLGETAALNYIFNVSNGNNHIFTSIAITNTPRCVFCRSLLKAWCPGLHCL